MKNLVLLPGLGCDATLWHALLPALCTRARVHVTDVHFRFDRVEDMAEALRAELRRPAVWIASSLGGAVALEAAQQDRRAVLGLALIGCSARPDTPEQLRLRKDAILAFEQGRMEEVLRANAPLVLHPHSAARPELVARYLALVRRAGAQQLVQQNRAAMARSDQRALLGAIRCPTLVACGEADRITPPECSRELAAGIRTAQLEMLPGCGHLPMLEPPAHTSTGSMIS